ncbi:MAG: hypothetical protein LBD21_01315 [Tannerellaceae bacterium]|jgi:hypothetical protein|nr:hypothetical protein [Tannerellaceae bacterium]
MKQTFIYKEKFAYNSCYSVLALVLISVLFAVFKYDFIVLKFTVLRYPFSLFLFAAATLVNMAFVYKRYMYARQSQQNPSPVETGDSAFSFPRGKDVVRLSYADVKELWHKKNSDDGELVLLYTTARKRYEFQSRFFASIEAFAEFEEILAERCTNIINR